jgi:hypothetical protein
MKDGYFVGATAYMASIGPPSDGKTPALKAVADAIRAIDDKMAAEHARAIEQWNADVAAMPAPKKGIKPKPSPPPKPRRIDIDDATFEVLPIILADNPRGLIMIRDELSALILGMNQFKGGKGNDRANALKIWSGDGIIKDRVGRETRPPRDGRPARDESGPPPPARIGPRRFNTRSTCAVGGLTASGGSRPPHYRAGKSWHRGDGDRR